MNRTTLTNYEAGRPLTSGRNKSRTGDSAQPVVQGHVRNLLMEGGKGSGGVRVPERSAQPQNSQHGPPRVVAEPRPKMIAQEVVP
eukprot:15982747-Heterocapsa_arctica.AAC.1